MPQRDHWLLGMRGALEQEVADAALRYFILDKLTDLADHMRYREE